MNTYKLGIDIGSTTVKIAILDENNQILFSDYERHFANIQETLQQKLGKEIAQASNEEIYGALLSMVQEMAGEKERTDSKKKLYYISAEFLIGKLLSNNMINLGIFNEVKDVLAQNGKNIAEIEEVEPEPSLGNGGLGRLAACFLDSIATLGLAGDGVGLNYHLGLFKQEFKNNLQRETPNPWIEAKSWLKKTDVVYPISFKGLNVNARMYDIEVTGYNNKTNKLHLFDIDSVDETIVEDGIAFNKEDIEKNLTLFLYPDDSDENGRLLRIYQQYFMVSAGAQLILDECTAKGCNLHDLADYAVIQINDTHPTMVIPELIRLLVERGLDMDEAIEVVSKTCAYTNHTILAEASAVGERVNLNVIFIQQYPACPCIDHNLQAFLHVSHISRVVCAGGIALVVVMGYHQPARQNPVSFQRLRGEFLQIIADFFPF